MFVDLIPMCLYRRKLKNIFLATSVHSTDFKKLVQTRGFLFIFREFYEPNRGLFVGKIIFNYTKECAKHER